jgi:hypothetical protein
MLQASIWHQTTIIYSISSWLLFSAKICRQDKTLWCSCSKTLIIPRPSGCRADAVLGSRNATHVSSDYWCTGALVHASSTWSLCCLGFTVVIRVLWHFNTFYLWVHISTFNQPMRLHSFSNFFQTQSRGYSIKCAIRDISKSVIISSFLYSMKQFHIFSISLNPVQLA